MTKKHEGQNEIKAHENTFTVQRHTHTTANGFKVQFEAAAAKRLKERTK